jgi:RNA polymerase sigma factor (sigma-70 family)
MRCIGTDEQLIEEYLTEGRDEAGRAFEDLVRRHGPMVMGVCRQVLRHHQDAEDVFQATFLSLARQAGTIRNRMVLGAWLREVAYRLALRKRTSLFRAPIPLAADCRGSADGPELAATRKELGQILHAEVDRLPEKYRVLVDQCYLKGRTNEEVARLLDCPVGTVKGRLFQAREMLRERLSQAEVARDDSGDGAGASWWTSACSATASASWERAWSCRLWWSTTISWT